MLEAFVVSGTQVEVLRVLYVEDDPALRGILSTILQGRRDIEVVAAVGDSRAALTAAQEQSVDVALLDLALGRDDMTGIEVGMQLRREHPAMGIVMLSQHQVPGFLTRMKPEERKGWSFILKRADLHPNYLVDVLKATSRGLNVIDPLMVAGATNGSDDVLDALTPRQRSIMAQASQGLDAPTIAQALSLTPAAVRQELSRCYQILVPDPPAGADLRTLAVIRYLREMRGHEATS